jgi:hypothetical protein
MAQGTDQYDARPLGRDCTRTPAHSLVPFTTSPVIDDLIARVDAKRDLINSRISLANAVSARAEPGASRRIVTLPISDAAP